MNRFERRKLRGEAGVTLIEMLIVVAILGLLAMFLTMIVAKTIQRQRVTAAAQEIRGDLQAACTRVFTTQQPVYVRIFKDATATPPVRRLDIMGDTAGTTIYQQYLVPTDISLSKADITQVESNWPVVNTYPMLECDSMGRTLDPNTGVQVQGTQTLSVTHVYMVDGTLHPRIVYTVTIYPLWNSVAVKSVW